MTDGVRQVSRRSIPSPTQPPGSAFEVSELNKSRRARGLAATLVSVMKTSRKTGRRRGGVERVCCSADPAAAPGPMALMLLMVKLPSEKFDDTRGGVRRIDGPPFWMAPPFHGNADEDRGVRRSGDPRGAGGQRDGRQEGFKGFHGSSPN